MALALLLLATNVSFSAPAARVENLLPNLANALGRKMESAPECRDEVLLIDVKDVDPSLLLKKVAEAADAEWQTKPDGTLLLTRPVQRVSKERAAAISERATELTALLTELREQTDALPAFDVKEAQLLMEAFRKLGDQPVLMPPRGGSPANRLAARVLSRLPVDDLAAMHDGDRLVFTSRPTPWQRGLPNGLQADIAQFAKDQALWASQAGGTGQGNNLAADTETGQPPFALHVRVTHYSDVSPAGASVTILDRNGRAFLQAQAMVLSKGFQKYLALQVPGSLWDLPAEDAAWGEATSLNYRAGTRPPSADLVGKTIRPDKFDPLSFVIGPTLVETARRRGHGIVANLPDVLMGEVEVRDGKVDLNAVERKLALDAIHHDGTGPIELVVPGDPLRAREMRVNRHALANLASAVHAQGMLRLDDLADYAAVTPVMVRGWDGLSFYTVRILLPRAERLAQLADGRFLRLYGNLSPAQRKSLRNGQVSGSTLSPAGKAALMDLVLNGGLRSTDPQGVWRTSPYQPDVSLDPTALLPASGVAGFFIKGLSQISPALIAGSPESGKYSAWTHVLVDNPNEPLTVLEGSELWPGEVETLSLEVGTNAAAWNGFLMDHRVRMDGPPTPPEKLPPGLRPTFRPFEP